MQGHVAIAAPEGRRATPNYSLKARVLRIKQTNGLNFSTALPTSPRRLPILPLGLFFMKFRGPQALSNRRRKTIVCATKAGYFLDGDAAALHDRLAVTGHSGGRNPLCAIPRFPDGAGRRRPASNRLT
jgi:hypothetical protein